jgi:hypothetical protein
MNRQLRFVLAVQTGVVVQTIVDELQGRPQCLDPIGMVARAGTFPEEVIPEDVGPAAFEFLQFIYAGAPEPDWLAAWHESCESSSGAGTAGHS